MSRLLLYSRDIHLYSVLVPALGVDSTLTIDSSRMRVRELISQGKCDVVILDFECHPASEQFEFLDELRRLAIPAVVVADNERGKLVELVRRGIHSFCRKPLAVSELAVTIRKAYEFAALKRDIEDTRVEPEPSPDCGEMFGSASPSLIVYDLIRRVASINVFVLITGESGTGKELIARAIHSLSDRKSSPFVAVSCGAIPESLIEAELFGSEKGAFTGASGRRTGYMEEAADGTLLLDEIGELSQHTQIKLLRVLQQREFMRLGSSSAIPLRARVLFATNRNLKQMVEQGTFREDFYYRLNVVGIQAQPLRDRREDIPRLAKHFLSKYARAYGKVVTDIKPDASMLLEEYAWPGNVRELENVIQSAIVLSDDESISASNLPEELQRCVPTSANDDLRWASFDEQLRDYKARLANEAVEECKGNKTLAAQSLGISRTYLHRLIREPGDAAPALKIA